MPRIVSSGRIPFDPGITIGYARVDDMLRIITFTSQGGLLARRIADRIPARIYRKFHTGRPYLDAQGGKGSACRKTEETGPWDFEPVEMSLADWASEGFAAGDPLLFIGAAGIAVRAIAGCIRDKMTDVPVLVADMQGNYVIPILSGHYGGANALAGQIAEMLGAAAVITTATDQVGAFAADLFAKEHNMRIRNPKALPRISGKAVSGEDVRIEWLIPTGVGEKTDPKQESDLQFHSRLMSMGKRAVDASDENPEEPTICLANTENLSACLEHLRTVCGTPEGVCIVTTEDVCNAAPESLCGGSPEDAADIRITAFPLTKEELESTETLYLTPQCVYAGIGCKKNVPAEKMESFVRSMCVASGIDPGALAGIASIDVKKEEPAIIALAETLGIPFVTYTAEELLAVPGHFPESPFVEKQVGVGEVSGRAAARLAGTGYRMLLPKVSRWGITLSLAVAAVIDNTGETDEETKDRVTCSAGR